MEIIVIKSFERIAGLAPDPARILEISALIAKAFDKRVELLAKFA
jgi:hypothetical protein